MIRECSWNKNQIEKKSLHPPPIDLFCRKHFSSIFAAKKRTFSREQFMKIKHSNLPFFHCLFETVTNSNLLNFFKKHQQKILHWLVVALKKDFMALFYGWGSTASRLEQVALEPGGSLGFTTKFSDEKLKYDEKLMKNWNIVITQKLLQQISWNFGHLLYTISFTCVQNFRTRNSLVNILQTRM